MNLLIRNLMRLSLLIAAWSGAMQSDAAPRADLWPHWSHAGESAARTIDHQMWQKFLSTYVRQDKTGANRVNYGAVSKVHKSDLDEYIRRQAGITITGYPRDEQLAFWINLYNALTVQVVLDHYPVSSIKKINISPGWFSSGPWDKKLVTIEGKALSLNDIEHRILRPIWQDPRIHYAVNCASVGCPDLSRSAYLAATIEQQLSRASRNYINHPRGVTVLHGAVQVSSIYKWFQDDFGGSEQAVLRHIRQFASAELRYQLKNISDISSYQYDWTLNDQLPELDK